MKILFLSINPNQKGGVCEFVKSFTLMAKEQYIYFFYSSSGKEMNYVYKYILLIKDILLFSRIIIVKRIDLIFLNPSLKRNSIIRDGIYALIANLFKIKIYIHWHGWDKNNEYLLSNFFCRNGLFKANHIRVLSNGFLLKLIENGYKNKLSVGNTMIGDELINLRKKHIIKDKDKIVILFLATISKNKGIYEAISIFLALQKKYPNINLSIVGDGPELKNITTYILENNFTNIECPGYLDGDRKVLAYKNADLYLFPSYYEGMPTSVLEAMYFGLPVVCTLVGGIKDFFQPGKMGFTINNPSDIESFVDAIELILTNSKLKKSIRQYNKHYSSQHFLSGPTVNKIENEIKQILI